MTALARTLTRTAFSRGAVRDLAAVVADGAATRLVAVVALAAVALSIPGGVGTAAQAISDAYLAVTVFVAGTLAVLYAAEGVFKSDIGGVLSRHRAYQVPAGAVLGALPGCGGAIVAVTQFTRGSMSFGGVVATLTSTMGDAMFLLIAREPSTALLVAGVGIVAGIVTGYGVDAVHGQRFMQPDTPATDSAARFVWSDGSITATEKAWYALLVPGIAVGVMAAFQVEIENARVEATVLALGVIGGVLAVGMWVLRGGDQRDCRNGVCQVTPKARKVVDDSNFVTAWVVFAFVGYELFVHASGVDLAAGFAVWAAAVPAMAIVIGFLPGCGPQIVTTSLYLDGAIPLSAQLGNAISNDGDALFPAIAKAPGAAALATVYSAVPAIVVAYGAYALGY